VCVVYCAKEREEYLAVKDVKQNVGGCVSWWAEKWSF